MKRVFPGIVLAVVCGTLLQSCTNARGDKGLVDQDGDKPVINKFDWQPLVYDSSKQYIYLSFDDGPQHGTVTCFERCRKDNIKASFFMVGLHATQKSDGHKIVATIREAYPEILLANHSYSHAMGKYRDFYQHPASAGHDFQRAQDSLHIPFRIARLPGNNAWAESGSIRASWLTRPVSQLLDSAGYFVIGWDVEWRFNRKARPVQTPGALAAEVDSAFARNKTRTPNHLVILTHDRMFQQPSDADSLAKFIAILKQNPRYVFETVDHYPGVRGRN